MSGGRFSELIVTWNFRGSKHSGLLSFQRLLQGDPCWVASEFVWILCPKGTSNGRPGLGAAKTGNDTKKRALVNSFLEMLLRCTPFGHGPETCANIDRPDACNSKQQSTLYPIIITHSISLPSTSPKVKDTVIFASIFSDSLHLIGTVFVAAVAANLGIVRQTALADSMRQGAGKGDGLLRLWLNFAGQRFRSLLQHCS